MREKAAWNSVDERLPEDSVDVLVMTSIGGYRIGRFAYVGGRGAVWFKCGKSCITCTHWMHLPERPEGVKYLGTQF